MCVVSMVGDFAKDRWPKQYPWTVTQPSGESWTPREVSRAEFEALKREVEMIKELLERAKIYDQVNNEPNCEMEDKIELLKRVASLVGVELDFK